MVKVSEQEAEQSGSSGTSPMHSAGERAREDPARACATLAPNSRGFADARPCTPAEAIVLAESSARAVVLVALVASDVQDHLHARQLPRGFQHVHRAHHVCRKGLDRLLIGGTH